MAVVGKTPSKLNLDDEQTEKIKDMDTEFQTKFIEAEGMFKLLFGDEIYETKRFKTEFGTELHVTTSVNIDKIREFSDAMALPEVYGEWKMEAVFSDNPNALKYWYAWGVRLEFVKAANGFNSVKNWLNSIGCTDCVPYTEGKPRIKFCEVHKK